MSYWLWTNWYSQEYVRNLLVIRLVGLVPQVMCVAVVAALLLLLLLLLVGVVLRLPIVVPTWNLVPHGWWWLVVEEWQQWWHSSWWNCSRFVPTRLVLDHHVSIWLPQCFPYVPESAARSNPTPLDPMVHRTWIPASITLLRT